MKRKRLYTSMAAGLLAAILLCLSLTPAFAAWPDVDFAAAQNLIQNGDFAQGFDDWTVQGDCSLAPGPAAEGSSARLPGGENSSLRQTISFPAPGDYVLKGSFLWESGNPDLSCIIKLLFKDNPLEFNVQADSSWRKASVSFTIPSDSPLSVTMEITHSILAGNIRVGGLYLVSQTDLPDVPTPAPEDNLLPNPGFENGVKGWGTFFGNPNLTQADEARSGSHSLLISGSTRANSVASYHIDKPSPEGEYEMSGWLRLPYAPNQTPVLLLMAFAGLNTNSNTLTFVNSGVTLPYDGNWHPISITMELNQPTDFLLLVGSSSKVGVDIYVDDLCIAPVNREPQPEGPNLLQNPGFEAGLDSWEVMGTGGIFTTDAVACTGEQCAWFSYFQLGAMETYLTQTVAVNSPGNYTFFGSIRPDSTLSGAGAILFLEARDETGAVLASAASPFVSAPQNLWQRTSVTLAAPEGTAFLTVKLGGAYCTGAFYADRLSLHKTADEPK